MIGFLKQSNLTDIASQGAGATGLKQTGPRPGANNVGPAATSNFIKSGVMTAGAAKDAKPESVATGSTPATTSNFLKSGICVASPAPASSLPTIPEEEEPQQSKGSRNKKKRMNKKKNKQAGEKYEPVSVPSKEEMMKVYSVGMAAAD
jgi:hypothetical protein